MVPHRSPPRTRLWIVLGLLMIGAALLGRSVPRLPPSDRPSLPPAAERRLVPGTAALHSLRGGETHVYRVPLEAGQVFRAEVVQQGIDAEVALLRPGGEVLLAVDSPNGVSGPEPVFAVADEGGDHLLTVSSGAAPEVQGKYLLRTSSLRAASQRDRLQAAAALAFSAGEAHRRWGTDEGYQKATAKYEEAQRIWRNLGDTGQQATALYRLGWVRQDQGSLAEALPLLLAALRLSRDGLERAGVLNRLGAVYNALGDPQKAIAAGQQALALSRRIGDRYSETRSLETLGETYWRWGRLDEAREVYEDALALRRTTGYSPAPILRSLGELHLGLGSPGRALHLCQQALDLQRAAANASAESWSLKCVGMAFHGAGMEGMAVQHLRRAEERAHLAGSHQARAAALNDLGSIYLEGGGLALAQEVFSEALRIHSTIGDPQGQVYSLLGLGRVRHLQGAPGGALESYREAEAISRREGDPYGLAAVRQLQALVEGEQGRSDRAAALAEEALDLVEVLRSQAGSRDQRSSFSGSRSSYYEVYIRLLLQLHARHPDGGYDVRAFEASERFRAPAQLEALTEVRSKAGARIPREQRLRQEQLEQRLQGKLRDQIIATSEPPSPERRRRLATLESEVRDLLGQLASLREEIAESNPRYGELVQPKPATLPEVQQLLDEDTALVSYFLGEERSYAWWIERDAVASRELPGRAEIEAVARRAHLLLARSRLQAVRTDLARTLDRLSQLVIDPFADRLAGKKVLLVVPDGALQSIPFAVLQPLGAAEPLIASHVLAYLPSASVPGMLRRQREGRRPAAKQLAVLADPVFSPDDSRVAGRGEGGTWTVSLQDLDHRRADELVRLPHSRREAEAILGLVPPAESSRFLDFDANRDTARSPDLREHDYIHFAAHGIVDPRQPELSGIQLSRIDRRGHPTNGLLRFYEVYNMDLPVELVTLGACRSAVGPQVRGEGVVGMTRSFLYAGASRVVGSLWDVSDAATAELMTRLYRGILREGKTPAAALRDAQLSMIRQETWSSPYFWAGFVLQGDWR